ncbi:MAG: hypothetical protein ACRCT8_13045 [Lacipirellulaceae bacterium]
MRADPTRPLFYGALFWRYVWPATNLVVLAYLGALAVAFTMRLISQSPESGTVYADGYLSVSSDRKPNSARPDVSVGMASSGVLFTESIAQEDDAADERRAEVAVGLRHGAWFEYSGGDGLAPVPRRAAVTIANVAYVDYDADGTFELRMHPANAKPDLEAGSSLEVWFEQRWAPVKKLGARNGRMVLQGGETVGYDRIDQAWKPVDDNA